MVMWFMIGQKMSRSAIRLNQFNIMRLLPKQELKKDLPIKAIRRIRFGISQKQKMVKVYVLFLQTNQNSKAVISFQSDTSKT